MSGDRKFGKKTILVTFLNANKNPGPDAPMPEEEEHPTTAPASWEAIPSSPTNPNWPACSVWGVTFSQAALQWAQHIRWRPNCSEGFVSWTELCISFSATMAIPLPRPSPWVKGTFLTEGVHYTPVLHQRSLGEEIKAFQHAMRTLSSITGSEIFPWSQGGRQNLARKYGVNLQAMGFLRAAWIPKYAEVKTLLCYYLHTFGNAANLSKPLKVPRQKFDIRPEDGIYTAKGLLDNANRWRVAHVGMCRKSRGS